MKQGMVVGVAALFACAALLQAAPALAAAAGASEQAVGDRSIEDLQRRLRALTGQLDELRERSPGRATEERAHWHDVQDYVLRLMKLAQGTTDTDRTIAVPTHSGTDCELPPQIDVGSYTAKTGELLLRWREALIAVHQTPPGAERTQLLQRHAQTAYREIESLRIQIWLHGHPTPDAAPNRAVPEATSEGAYLVGLYCTQCHAAPAPALHTASEWYDAAAKMSTHIGVANADRAEAVQVPKALEMTLIETYLQTYACQPARSAAP